MPYYYISKAGGSGAVSELPPEKFDIYKGKSRGRYVNVGEQEYYRTIERWNVEARQEEIKSLTEPRYVTYEDAPTGGVVKRVSKEKPPQKPKAISPVSGPEYRVRSGMWESTLKPRTVQQLKEGKLGVPEGSVAMGGAIATPKAAEALRVSEEVKWKKEYKKIWDVKKSQIIPQKKDITESEEEFTPVFSKTDFTAPRTPSPQETTTEHKTLMWHDYYQSTLQETEPPKGKIAEQFRKAEEYDIAATRARIEGKSITAMGLTGKSALVSFGGTIRQMPKAMLTLESYNPYTSIKAIGKDLQGARTGASAGSGIGKVGAVAVMAAITRGVIKYAKQSGIKPNVLLTQGKTKRAIVGKETYDISTFEAKITSGKNTYKATGRAAERYFPEQGDLLSDYKAVSEIVPKKGKTITATSRGTGRTTRTSTQKSVKVMDVDTKIKGMENQLRTKEVIETKSTDPAQMLGKEFSFVMKTPKKAKLTGMGTFESRQYWSVRGPVKELQFWLTRGKSQPTKTPFGVKILPDEAGVSKQTKPSMFKAKKGTLGRQLPTRERLISIEKPKIKTGEKVVGGVGQETFKTILKESVKGVEKTKVKGKPLLIYPQVSITRTEKVSVQEPKITKPTIALVKPVTVPSTKPLTVPSQKPISVSKPSTVSIQKPIQKPIQVPIQKPIQTPSVITKPTQIMKPTPFLTIPPPIGGGVVGGGFGWVPTPKFRRERKRRFKLKPIKTKYKPSVRAIVLDIRGKKPGRKRFTGLEFRPLIAKGLKFKQRRFRL